MALGWWVSGERQKPPCVRCFRYLCQCWNKKDERAPAAANSGSGEGEKIQHMNICVKCGCTECRCPPKKKASTKGTTPYGKARQAALWKFELEYVTRLLKQTKGGVTAAAKFAGIHRSNFRHVMARLGIKSADFREKPATPAQADRIAFDQTIDDSNDFENEPGDRL
jgi:hypothetical protein